MDIKVETTAIMLLLPREVKNWNAAEAAKTLASQNSEIVHCIRAQMDQQ